MNPSPASETILGALAPTASPRDVAAAAEALRALAERALPGSDPAAHAEYHSVLYELNERNEPATLGVRRYLTSTVYALEDAHLPLVEEPREALTTEQLLARVQGSLSMRARLGSSLSSQLFEGNPTRAQVKVYLLHHWYRSRGFYKLLSEFALRTPLAEAGVLYRNLYEEAGGEPSTPAHAFLLQRLIQYLELPAGLEDRPPVTEGLAYLNNRTRCVRHPHPAWGLAVLYALEYVTPETHGSIYRMLQRNGIPEEYCTFHRIHITGDEEHAKDLEGLIATQVRTAEAQRLFLTSLRQHQQLSRDYFRRIWQEIEAAGGTP